MHQRRCIDSSTTAPQPVSQHDGRLGMIDFKPHFEKMCKGLFPDDNGRWRLNEVISSEGIYWLEVTCSSFNRPEEPVRIATSGYSHQDVIACCQKENGEWSVFFHGNGWENIASIANMLNPTAPYNPHLISTVHRRRSKTYTPQEIYEFYGSTQEEVRDEFGEPNQIWNNSGTLCWTYFALSKMEGQKVASHSIFCFDSHGTGSGFDYDYVMMPSKWDKFWHDYPHK